MKRLMLLIVFLLLGCSNEQGVNWLRGSFTEALDQGREQNKPILVDFFSDT